MRHVHANEHEPAPTVVRSMEAVNSHVGQGVDGARPPCAHPTSCPTAARKSYSLKMEQFIASNNKNLGAGGRCPSGS